MTPPEVDDSYPQTICLVSIFLHHCILIQGEVLTKYESLALPLLPLFWYSVPKA